MLGQTVLSSSDAIEKISAMVSIAVSTFYARLVLSTCCFFYNLVGMPSEQRCYGKVSCFMF